MNESYPVPPPELVEQWRVAPEYTNCREKLTMVSMTTRRLQEIATQAARWGADQELEACVEWLDNEIGAVDPRHLRAARRPEPPSLKKQALAVVKNSAICDHLTPEHEAILRRALESLPD